MARKVTAFVASVLLLALVFVSYDGKHAILNTDGVVLEHLQKSF
jgi:hypothetical protein